MTETRLTPGDAAPEFTLPTADGGTISLDTYRGKRVILYFYPAAMTPGCTKQACDFARQPQPAHGRGFRRPRRVEGQAGEAGQVRRA
ncbi:hypothetical protein GCM10020220_096600 [Nonomuraea rubra]